ncbi:MAG: TetR/AcrR family transcriptional regulator [Myxococcota bacterium]
MDLITEQKLERRARILSGARELIAERGYAGLTMRDLAAHCRVSVPTLYNQFGSKDALLAAAVEGHFQGVLARTRETAQDLGAARVLAVVAQCADDIAALPRYNRALMQAFVHGRETVARLSIASELAAELERGLEEMRSRRQLADWVSARVLADRITASCIAASMMWLVGEFDAEKTRAAMLHATSTMVLGCARGAARRPLEAAARDAQAVLETTGRRVATAAANATDTATATG